MVPAGPPADASERDQRQPAASLAAQPTPPVDYGGDCTAETICRIKNKVRWRTPAWSPEFCGKVAQAVQSAAQKYDVSPALILAVMINESDMNEDAVRVTEKNGEPYAKDIGLMGIRCVLDQLGRCTNAHVRGMTWKQVMDPFTNIELGARELSKWRRAGVARATVRVRGADGRLQVKQKFVQCQHRTHAYWAHYNHGPLYHDSGPARHYPHRIAVLYYELARVLNVDAPELRQGQRITIIDPGKRPRTADRPIEPRYRKLCEQIRSVGGRCASVASLPAVQRLN